MEYVKFEMCGNGDLLLVPDMEAINADRGLIDLFGIGTEANDMLAELLEEQLCNGYEIGTGLMDSFILSEAGSDGVHFWYFPNYMVEEPASVRLLRGESVLMEYSQRD